MAINRVNTGSLRRMASSNNEGGVTPMAESSTSGGTNTNLRTPDYHLPYTGLEVHQALQKIMDLDLNEVGGTTIIPSEPTAPADIDHLTQLGNFIINYIQASDLPADLQGYQPINLSVYRDPNGHLVQLIEAGGIKYYRISDDNGLTWSEWILKSTNEPDIPSGKPGPGETPPNVIKTIQDTIATHGTDIANLGTQLNGVKGNYVKLGAVNDATAMLNGTYNYP